MSLKKLAAGVALTTLAQLLAVGAVHAQEITGTLHGRVTDGAAPVANASVVIRHDPTGTRTTVVTAGDGTYDARGLRVGGPYTVTVSAGGRSATAQAANVAVGDPTILDVSLSTTQVAEVTVSASRATRAQPGLSTAFSAGAIATVPTINRDIKDVVRLNPFATIDPSNSDALSFAGANTRFNQLTVDSIRQNDDFGVNNNGYPTQRSPISLDAVQALQVSVAPYSVLNDGFLGGTVNVVTKSGTNAFHGSAFGEFDSDRARGHKINDLAAGGNLKETTYGATFGGPILKDKLFFFLSYDKYKGDFIIDEGPVGSGRSSIIPRISVGAVDTLRAAAQSVYGYDPGSWVSTVPSVNDTKYLGKIDWNITDNHRLSLTYQDTHGTSFNGAAIDLFTTGDSTTQPRVGLADDQYIKDEHLTTVNLQLNSRWTDNFSTELRVGRKETDTNRVVPGLVVGQTTVTVTDLAGVGAGTGTPQVQFGTEINSQPNYLNVFTDTAELIARYNLDTHRLQAGVRSEHQDITNIFGRQYLGTYSFASYADFLARKATSFALTGAVDPGAAGVPATYNTAGKGAGALNFNQNSVYFDDTWQARQNLSILYGVRYNWYAQGNIPVLNTSFVSREGFANTANLNGRSIVLPRIYAKYLPIDGLNIEVGYGRFSNTGLGVWIENPWANDGVRQVNAVCPAGPYLNVNLKAPPAGCTFTAGNGNVNALSPNLKIPSAWKASLSIGYNFAAPVVGDNWRVQFDYLDTQNRDALIQSDLRAVQIGTAPDGRPIYGRSTTGVIGANVFDMLLTNSSDGGHANSAAISLAKTFDKGLAQGLSLQAGYTYTRATDRNPMTSSIADSSYVRFASSDPEHPPLATSDYEIRDKYTFIATFVHKFFGDNNTGVTLYALKRSGLPFSYTFDNSRTGNFDNDFGNLVTQTYSGRQASSNQLFYVPAMSGGAVTATSDPRVTYAAGFDVAAFDRYLKNSGLAQYAGQIAPRNAFRGKDIFTVDLHLSQEIPAFVPRGSKLQVYFDLKNLGNLLNNKWGVTEQYDFYRGVPVADVKIVNGQYVYSGLRTAAGTSDRPIKPFNVVNTSLWLAKIGLRYTF